VVVVVVVPTPGDVIVVVVVVVVVVVPSLILLMRIIPESPTLRPINVLALSFKLTRQAVVLPMALFS